MDQRLIKLRTVICQSPDLPAIHLSKSLITNDTCGLRSTISLKCSCAVIFFLSFFLRGVVENNTDAVVQVKADRCLKGGDVCPTLSEQISLKKVACFIFIFLWSGCSFLRPQSLHLSLQPLVSLQISRLLALCYLLLVSHILMHPIISSCFSFYTKSSMYTRVGREQFSFFSPAPFIHPPVSKPTSRCLCLFVLVFNSFLAPSLFSYFFCQWTDFFLSRSGAD